MRRLASFLIAATLLLTMPAVAFADAPSNDNFADATAIGAFPFYDTVDTTEATTEALDADAAGGCFGDQVSATIWYSLDAAESATYEVADMASFETGLVVVTGAPEAFSLVTCGQGDILFDGEAGMTYYVLVGDVSGGTGGQVQFYANLIPPPPAIGLTIDPIGTVSRGTGMVTVSGSLTCSAPAGVFLDLAVRQRAGRQYIDGYGFNKEPLTCSDELTWTLTTDSVTGVFVGGHATVTLQGYAFALGSDDIGANATPPGVEVTAVIRLRPVR